MTTTVEYDPSKSGGVPLRSVQRPRPLSTLAASAQRITSKEVKRLGNSGKSESWQDDAWDMHDLVGEQRFLAHTLAGRLAQARFYAGRLPDNRTEDVEPLTDGPAAEVLDFLIGHGAQFPQIVERAGVNLFIPGDCYLVGIPPEEEEADASPVPPPSQGITPIGQQPSLPGVDLSTLRWSLRSVSEVSFDNEEQVVIKNGSGREASKAYDADAIMLIRIWRPHPRYHWQADSPTRSSLPVLRELVGLTMHISAQVDSRLAGAGVFLVPESADRALRAAAGIPEDDEEGDADSPLAVALMEHMVTPISDRSSASAIVPIMPVVPDESIEKFRYISFAGALDAEARSLRDEAIRRLALGQDCPPELLLGVGCVDTETTILTAQGWKSYDEVSEGDLVLTINHETGVSEWQPVLAMSVFERVAEPMLRMSGKGHDSLTTLNHRWPVTSANHDRREFVTSADLNTGHLIPTSAPHADLPTEAKFSDAFVELVAWFWTEGHYGPRTGRWGQATIAQSASKNPGRVDAIRLALDTSFPGGWGTETRQRGEWDSDVVRFNLRKHVYEALAEVGGKHVTLDFIRSLTRAQLELFIDISAQGDGWHYSDGRLDIWQRDPSALDAYELALILSGRTVTRTQYADGEVVNPYVKDTVRPIKAGIATEEVYTGTVWCPTTENGTWFARRNGTTWFTGNSMNHWGAWLVREDVVTTHIEPPLALICDALTTQFLWPVLIEQGMSEEEAHTYVVWYDVEHMIMRPDRSQDAKDLHGAGVLSDTALRDATGFDETDAPEADPTDPAVKLTLDLVRGAPSLMQNPGLDVIASQIRAMLDNAPIPGLPDAGAPVDATPPTDPASDPSTEGGPPATDGADGQPPPALAASGFIGLDYDGSLDLGEPEPLEA